MDDRASLARRFVNTAYVGVLASLERRIPFWPIERLGHLQQHRLRSIIQHAYDTVPFYRQVMEERHWRPRDFKSFTDLSALPLLDDSFVWSNLKQFMSSQYMHRPVLTFHTSGTYSKLQKPIYWDPLNALRRLAYNERDRAVLSRLLGQGWGQNQLFLLPEVSVSRIMRNFWDRQILTHHGIARRSFFSPERPFEEVVSQMNTVKPQVVFSYGSYAEEFFRFLADRRHPMALPKVWMYGGDMLSAAGREFIEKNFDCIVYATYQTVESGKIGFQCERCEGFHLNMDLAPIRLIDESGQTVKPGRPGEVVVSNLYNRAMVLLNYRLGDQGVLATQPCPCGRNLPLLEKLGGRVYETIRLPDGRRFITDVLEIDFKEELKSSLHAQINQVESERLLWKIVPSLSTDREVLRQRLLKKSKSIFGDIEVEVEFVEKIPRTSAGKFLRVIPLKTGI
jgi:phenylacetate-coenzyme A ligase PaaK-like adenylate-forming protein